MVNGDRTKRVQTITFLPRVGGGGRSIRTETITLPSGKTTAVETGRGRVRRIEEAVSKDIAEIQAAEKKAIQTAKVTVPVVPVPTKTQQNVAFIKAAKERGPRRLSAAESVEILRRGGTVQDILEIDPRARSVERRLEAEKTVGLRREPTPEEKKTAIEKQQEQLAPSTREVLQAADRPSAVFAAEGRPPSVEIAEKSLQLEKLEKIQEERKQKVLGAIGLDITETPAQKRERLVSQGKSAVERAAFQRQQLGSVVPGEEIQLPPPSPEFFGIAGPQFLRGLGSGIVTSGVEILNLGEREIRALRGDISFEEGLVGKGVGKVKDVFTVSPTAENVFLPKEIIPLVGVGPEPKKVVTPLTLEGGTKFVSEPSSLVSVVDEGPKITLTGVGVAALVTGVAVTEAFFGQTPAEAGAFIGKEATFLFGPELAIKGTKVAVKGAKVVGRLRAETTPIKTFLRTPEGERLALAGLRLKPKPAPEPPLFFQVEFGRGTLIEEVAVTGAGGVAEQRLFGTAKAIITETPKPGSKALKVTGRGEAITAVGGGAGIETLTFRGFEGGTELLSGAALAEPQIVTGISEVVLRSQKAAVAERAAVERIRGQLGLLELQGKAIGISGRDLTPRGILGFERELFPLSAAAQTRTKDVSILVGSRFPRIGALPSTTGVGFRIGEAPKVVSVKAPIPRPQLGGVVEVDVLLGRAERRRGVVGVSLLPDVLQPSVGVTDVGVFLQRQETRADFLKRLARDINLRRRAEFVRVKSKELGIDPLTGKPLERGVFFGDVSGVRGPSPIGVETAKRFKKGETVEQFLIRTEKAKIPKKVSAEELAKLKRFERLALGTEPQVVPKDIFGPVTRFVGRRVRKVRGEKLRPGRADILFEIRREALLEPTKFRAGVGVSARGITIQAGKITEVPLAPKPIAPFKLRPTDVFAKKVPPRRTVEFLTEPVFRFTDPEAVELVGFRAVLETTRVKKILEVKRGVRKLTVEQKGVGVFPLPFGAEEVSRRKAEAERARRFVTEVPPVPPRRRGAVLEPPAVRVVPEAALFEEPFVTAPIKIAKPVPRPSLVGERGVRRIGVGGLGRVRPEVGVVPLTRAEVFVSPREVSGVVSRSKGVTDAVAESKGISDAVSVSKSLSKSVSRSKSAVKVTSVSKSVAKSVSLSRSVSRGLTPRGVPKTRIPRLLVPPLPRVKVPPSASGGFDVFVKEKAKGSRFFRANKVPLRRNRALNFGAGIVDNSAARTFKLVASRKRPVKDRVDDAGFNLRAKFRQPKPKGKIARVPKPVFVELTRFAIDSAGERAQITAKGLIARRRQSAQRRSRLVTPTGVRF